MREGEGGERGITSDGHKSSWCTLKDSSGNLSREKLSQNLGFVAICESFLPPKFPAIRYEGRCVCMREGGGQQVKVHLQLRQNKVKIIFHARI